MVKVTTYLVNIEDFKVLAEKLYAADYPGTELWTVDVQKMAIYVNIVRHNPRFYNQDSLVNKMSKEFSDKGGCVVSAEKVNGWEWLFFVVE